MPQRFTNICCICLDTVKCDLRCRKRHGVCSACFPRFVESLSENYPKLKAHKFKVRCPVPNCSSAPFSERLLKNRISPQSFRRLKEVIDQDFKQELPSIITGSASSTAADLPSESVLISQVLDCLNLKCPKCSHVVDPKPDGCAAMVCPHCAGFFCWLCFTETVVDAHPHVLECSLNSSGKQYNDYFPSQILKDKAHKIYRLNAIKTLLQPIYSCEGGGDTFVTTVLNKVDSTLQSFEITAAEVITLLSGATSSSSSSGEAAVVVNKKKRGLRELVALMW